MQPQGSCANTRCCSGNGLLQMEWFYVPVSRGPTCPQLQLTGTKTIIEIFFLIKPVFSMGFPLQASFSMPTIFLTLNFNVLVFLRTQAMISHLHCGWIPSISSSGTLDSSGLEALLILREEFFQRILECKSNKIKWDFLPGNLSAEGKQLHKYTFVFVFFQKCIATFDPSLSFRGFHNL